MRYFENMCPYRAGLCVVRGDRVVNVDKNAGFVTSVDTWNGNEGSWRATSAVGDFDLAARDVELSTAECACNVQSNSFHANEVSRIAH